MDRTTVIIILAVLLLLLIGTVSALMPTFKRFVHRMPRSILIVLMLVIIGVMIWLIVYLVNDLPGGGQTGENEHNRTETSQNEQENPLLEDCIIIRGKDIIINNLIADLNSLSDYIDERVENGTLLTIVDDYAVSSLYRSIIELCEEKGVKKEEQNEKWLEQQK